MVRRSNLRTCHMIRTLFVVSALLAAIALSACNREIERPVSSDYGALADRYAELQAS